MRPFQRRALEIARRLFDARTMERLIEPTVADIELEYTEIMNQGRKWRARWIAVYGCGSLFKVATIEGSRRAGALLFDRIAHRARSRTKIKMAIGLASAMALIVPSLRNARSGVSLLPLPMITQTLPLSIPIGLLLAALVGFHWIPLRVRIAVMALAASVLSLGMALLTWAVDGRLGIMPATPLCLALLAVVLPSRRCRRPVVLSALGCLVGFTYYVATLASIFLVWPLTPIVFVAWNVNVALWVALAALWVDGCIGTAERSA